jgi:integrase
MSARTLNEALEDYYETKAGAMSPSTWTAHERQLEKFRAWVSRPAEAGPNCLLVDVDDRMMVRYFNRLRQTVSGSTFNNYRQYVGAFWQFCLGEAWTVKNPMRHIDPAPVVRRPRLQLSAQELLAALDGATPRDRIGLAVGMNTALRAGDIAALTVGSANLTNNVLHAYIAKTKTWDDIPITEELHRELRRWFAHYADTMGLTDWQRELPNGWTLVPAVQWTAVNVWEPGKGGVAKYKTSGTYHHIYEIPQRALRRLGHPTRQEGFHTIRRSAARRALEYAASEGDHAPIRVAQAMLGHKSQQTTEIYLGVTADRMRRDDLMRGRSFLTKVAQDEVDSTTIRQSRRRDDEGDGGLTAVNL